MPDVNKIKQILDEKLITFSASDFIASDPIQIPHCFKNKEDIEIAAFLTSILSWGQRKTIIANARLLMQLMDNSPFEFVMYASRSDLNRLNHFKHRTFQPVDCKYFINFLRQIYSTHNGLEQVFNYSYQKTKSLYFAIIELRRLFVMYNPPLRTRKHISDITRGSSAKRINMFLRWMVRSDGRGIDFGIWKSIPPSALYIPLDVHVANSARRLELLRRKYNDWQAVKELTQNLRLLDADDPIKYDYALFNLDID